MKQSQITLIVIGFILFTLMATNPSTEEHKDAIKKEIFKAIEIDNNPNSAQQLGEKIGESIGGALIDNIVERQNYVLFSLATVKIVKMEGVTNNAITLGIFGQIILLKKYDKDSKEFVGINESVATASVAFAATTDTAAFATETIDDNKNSNQNIPDNIASEDDATNSDGDIKSDPYSILTKILSYSNQNTFSGVSQVGYARGESYFDFSKLSRQFPNVLVTYTALNRKATEGGVLKNFRFSNSGKLNTNILYANWQNFEKDHAGSGTFELSVFDENEPNKVYIGISGNSWSYYINVQLTEQQFQEITNLLSISEKPKKTSLHNLSPMEDNHTRIPETPALEPINPVSIIGKPIKIGNIEVAEKDFPNKIKWDDAKKECERLGSGWRLPNKEELNLLFKNKIKIGGFAKGNDYWSLSEDELGNASKQDFNNGMQYYNGKDNILKVRAVRDF